LKTRRKTLWLIILTASMSLLLAACGGGGGGEGTPAPLPTPPPGATLQNLTVTPVDASIKVGDTQQFVATGRYSDGKDYVITSQVTWSSYDETCATIDATGLATAVDVGLVGLEAFHDGFMDTVTLTVNIVITPGGSEGDPANPVRLYVDQTHTGNVGSFPSYYYFQSNGAGKYSIDLADTPSNLGWALYDTSDFSSLVATCNDNNARGGERCIVTLQASTYYYLTVINWSFDDAAFNVTVLEGLGEGSAAVPLAVGEGTRKTDIAANSSNYYVFTPGADGSHSVSVSEELGISVYDTPDFSTGLVKSCAPKFDGTACTLNGLTAGVPYYIRVDEPNGVDTVFDMTVKAGVSEGSTTDPVALTIGTAHSGGVDAYGNSYYQFTTPAGGTGSYILSLGNVSLADTSYLPGDYDSYLTNYVALHIYSDFAQPPLASCDGLGDCPVSGLLENTTYYAEVNNFNTSYSYTSSDMTYDITVSAGQCVGSVDAPASVNLDVQYSGNMDEGCASYFTVTTAESGSYDVSIANTPGYEYWYVYSDAAFSNQTDFWYNSVPSTVTTTNLDGAKPYYLKIENQSLSAGQLTFTITKGASEGSANDPAPLLVNTPHAGSVSAWDSGSWDGYSYYTFTPPADGDYLVVLNNASPMSAMLWDQPGFVTSNEIASWSSSTYLYSQLNALTGGTAYYYRVRNGTSSDQAYTIEFASLNPADGCSASAVDCVDFENGGVLPSGLTTPPAVSPWDTALTWALDNAESATAGTYSLSSQDLPYPDEACFEYAPPVDTWQISFSYKISGSDSQFQLWINGNWVTGTWYSNTQWTRAVFTTTPGPNTYTICYDRMYNSSGLPEIMWIDDIEFR
jgi:hypothetical protein